MNPKEWIQSRLAQVPVNLAANFLGNWLDGFGEPGKAVSPEELEKAARDGRNLLADSLAGVSRQDLAQARAAAAPLIRSIRREDYVHVLEALEWSHPEHVKVLVRYPEWVVQQFDAALTLLGGRAG